MIYLITHPEKVLLDESSISQKFPSFSAMGEKELYSISQFVVDLHKNHFLSKSEVTFIVCGTGKRFREVRNFLIREMQVNIPTRYYDFLGNDTSRYAGKVVLPDETVLAEEEYGLLAEILKPKDAWEFIQGIDQVYPDDKIIITGKQFLDCFLAKRTQSGSIYQLELDRKTAIPIMERGEIKFSD